MKKYDDIMDLPHHRSSVHPPMPMKDRAAQFSPFAALTGYRDAVREAERLTEAEIELSEDERSRLDEKLQIVNDAAGSGEVFYLTYFEPDVSKKGGAYRCCSGSVKNIDGIRGIIDMSDGASIEISRIIEIEGDCFRRYGMDR